MTFIFRMKRVIACVDNGLNVLRTLTYTPDSWATFYHTSEQFYQNYHSMATKNDGSIDIDEVRKIYSKAKQQFPDSDAFSMSADKHVEGESSLISDCHFKDTLILSKSKASYLKDSCQEYPLKKLRFKSLCSVTTWTTAGN